MSETAPSVVYLLCMGTSALCALLLVRAWMRSRTSLLLWTAACFVLLAVDNVLLVAHLLFLPQVHLGLVRGLISLAAVGVLLFGFLQET
jgi:hypothetical protein